MRCKIDVTNMIYGKTYSLEKIINSSKEFLSQHPIDWSLYDCSCLEDEVLSIGAFAKQQGWLFYKGTKEQTYLYGEVGDFISTAIALDSSAPEEVLIGLVPYDVDSGGSGDYYFPLLYALLTNPSSTEEVLKTICNSFYYEDEKVFGDAEAFRLLFKHPNLTEDVMDVLASNVVEKADGEAYAITQLKETPTEFLELLLKHSQKVSDCSPIFEYLAKAVNITPELLESLSN